MLLARLYLGDVTRCKERSPIFRSLDPTRTVRLSKIA